MDDKTYRIICDLITGKFKIPRKDWTNVVKNAYMRFYRNKECFTIQKGHLYWNKKRVVSQDSQFSKISLEHAESLGSSSRKLFHRLRTKYKGISEGKITQFLKQDETHQQLNVKFTNKPPLKPVVANHVNERHQIDLMDMGKMKMCQHESNWYRYILTIVDVFSRYIWLWPMITKKSSEVLKSLRKTYDIVE